MEYPAVTQERLEQALTELNLNFGRDDDGDTILGFEELLCFFTVSDINFIGWANWMGGAKTDEDIADLYLAVNEVNKEVPMVRTRVIESEGSAFPQGFALFPVPDGASDEQLKSMVDYFFHASHMMAHLLNEQVGRLKFEDRNTEGCQ